MSEENTDKDQNFENLRKKAETLEAQVAELTAYKVNEVVRSVNLDPSAGNGAALKELLGADASEERAQELVAKFGWQADEPSEKTPELTKEERAAQEFANRRNDLQSVSVSDEPESIDDQISETHAALAAARAAKNWDQADALGKQLTRLNAEKMFGLTMAGG